MDKISVIVPAYNAEKHLRECLNSIVNQSYQNLEIILVDDGATDNTGKIFDEYKNEDSRIKVIHQKNCGLSAARNIGIDNATGKYIMFIDSDDFYEKNSCELLYNEISKRDADYVIGNYIHTNSNGEKWDQPLFDTEKYDNFELSVKDYKKSFFVMNSVVWNKIFKREFINQYKLRFIDRALAEDALFSIFCYTHTKKAYYINDVIYNYRQNEQNSSISTNCSKEYFLRINSSYKMLYNIFKDANEIGFFRYFYARITPYLLCKIIDTDKLNEEEMIEVLKTLRWYFCLKDNYNIVVLNKYLDTIVNNITQEQYKEAIKNIAIARKYRDSLDEVEKEKMYRPSEELYVKMSVYDNQY